MQLTIGNKIKVLRHHRNMSQQDLCDESINRVILSKIENNKMSPSISQLEHISKKFNIPINYFFTETNFALYSENAMKAYETSSILQEWYDNKLYGHIIKLEEMNPTNFNAIEDFNKYFYFGCALYKTKLFKHAIKPLRKYINSYMTSKEHVQNQYVLKFAFALNYLSLIMQENKNYEKAEHYLVLAKKFLNNYNQTNSRMNFIIHSNLGVLYIDSNQYEKTINVLESFLSENKNLSFQDILPNIHLSLNIAYYNIGDYEKSIDHVKKATFLYAYTNNSFFALDCTLNHINALRYGNRLKEAYDVLLEFKNKVPNYKITHHNFLVQEMILLLNMKDYSKALELSKTVILSKFNKISKANYNFILGHINFINDNYVASYKQLRFSEKTFLKENYSYDLAVLYNDLYLITNDGTYKNKSEEYALIRGRKNIIV